MVKQCLYCEITISPERASKAQTKFCSWKCKDAYTKQLYKRLNPRPMVSDATAGVISELRVAVDLLSKGYDVFRALSPGCPCDLAILRDGKLLKVEVTTGKYTPGGKMFYPPHDKNKYDIIAVVLHDRIYYSPSLPH